MNYKTVLCTKSCEYFYACKWLVPNLTVLWQTYGSMEYM